MKTTAKQSLSDRLRNIRHFAALVRGPVEVRTAFTGHRILAWWWKGVIALHGRPTPVDMPMQSRCACIADGFRFYGLLYRGLAGLIGTITLACCIASVLNIYWAILLFGSAVYLWVVSGLAFSGASELRDSEGKRVWQLVAFLFFIVLFLTGTLTAVSVQSRSTNWLPDPINLLLTASMFVFGVGSYFVELATLVANESLKLMSPPRYKQKRYPN